MNTRSLSTHRDHVFYTGMAVAMTLAVFVGFSRTYYLKQLFQTPVLTGITHVHGVLFTIWTLFFLAQVVLVALGRTTIHRRLGLVGGLLAVLVVVMGTSMTIVSVRIGHASGRPLMNVLLVNALMNLALFLGFFGARLYYRHKKEVHKRFMLLAMLSVIIPAYARLPLAQTTIGSLIMGSPLLGIAYDAVFLRRVHATNLIGAALIIATTPLRFAIAATTW